MEVPIAAPAFEHLFADPGRAIRLAPAGPVLVGAGSARLMAADRLPVRRLNVGLQGMPKRTIIRSAPPGNQRRFI